MDDTPEPVRFAACNWLFLLKTLSSKQQSPLKLPILETISFDPASSLIDFWVSSDSAGNLRRYERKTLLKTELLSACLKAILSPGELDLYHSEVEKCSTNNWMACFLLMRDGRRRLVRLHAFLRLVHQPEKLVTSQVVGIQFYAQMADSKKEFMYVVSVQSLPGAQYALHLYKVWYKCKFPDHILSQEQLQPSPLELRLVKMSRDVIKLVEERLSTTIRDMQLLYLLDLHNSLRLVGTQQTVLKDADPKPRFSNFRLPPATMSFVPSRCHSSTHLGEKGERRLGEVRPKGYLNEGWAEQSPKRPASNLVLRGKLKAKQRLPPVGRVSPLSSQLLVAPKRSRAESPVADASPPEAAKQLLMVDQEAQACTWDSIDSIDPKQSKSPFPLSKSKAEYSWSSGLQLHSLGVSTSINQLHTINSTISLPEPEPVPKVGAVRLGSLKKNRGKGIARVFAQ